MGHPLVVVAHHFFCHVVGKGEWKRGLANSTLLLEIAAKRQNPYGIQTGECEVHSI